VIGVFYIRSKKKEPLIFYRRSASSLRRSIASYGRRVSAYGRRISAYGRTSAKHNSVYASLEMSTFYEVA